MQISTDKQAMKLKPGPKARSVRIRQLPGLYLRVTPAGGKSFAVVARKPNGKQVWHRLGGPELTLEDAIDQGRQAIKRIKAGKPAKATAPLTYGTLFERYMVEHVKQEGLISAPEIRRLLERHILPELGDRPVAEVRRKELTDWLSVIRNDVSPHVAQAVLAQVSAMLRWHALNDEDYTVVLAAKYRIIEPVMRDRVLDDDEIRALWAATDDGAPYSAIVRLLLLTGQRRKKIATMKWSDLEGDLWTVASESSREKGTIERVRLPAMAMAEIEAQPRMGSPYIFPGRQQAGRKTEHFNGFSPCKRRLDAKLDFAKPWRLHDLRSTARTIMAEAEALDEHAERALGHKQDKIVEIYNRAKYLNEKSQMLALVATRVAAIVEPKVVALRG